MKKLEFLNQIAAKIESQTAEIESINLQEPILKADIENKVSALSETIPAEKMFALSVDEQGLDPEILYALKFLEGLRLRLTLLPGVRTRLTNALDKTQKDALRLAHETEDDLVEDARNKIEELTIKTYEQLLPICGNDIARTRTATKAVIDASELTKWLNSFRHLIGRASPSDLRQFYKYASAYKNGKSVADVSAK